MFTKRSVKNKLRYENENENAFVSLYEVNQQKHFVIWKKFCCKGDEDAKKIVAMLQEAFPKAECRMIVIS